MIIFPPLSAVINSFLFPWYFIILINVFPSKVEISFINLSFPGSPKSRIQIFPFLLPVKINNFLKSMWNPLIEALSEVWTDASKVGGNCAIE